MKAKSTSKKPRARTERAKPRSVQRMVGRSGTFIGADGVEYACIIRGADEPPWDDLCYLVDYVRNQVLIKNAMIPVAGFRPDKAAWDKHAASG